MKFHFVFQVIHAHAIILHGSFKYLLLNNVHLRVQSKITQFQV
jgi:hypothetical protein